MTTAPATLYTFFSKQAVLARERGFELAAISSPGSELTTFAAETRVKTYPVRMNRYVSPCADIVAIWRLVRIFRRLRPELIHTHTPKAGFLGMIAGWIARVPTRIYTINGLVLETRSGAERSVLIAADRLAIRLATRVLCVSETLKRLAVSFGLGPEHKLAVLGNGSSHGVNLSIFSPAQAALLRSSMRRELQIPDTVLVLGFVGRFVRDKGVYELAGAWWRIKDSLPSAHLIICGAPECEDDAGLLDRLSEDKRVHHISASPREMPRVYSALDITVLPSYREGMPNVALESGAMGLPIIATKVSGCVDIIVDGVTGRLVPPGDSDALARAMRDLACDSGLRFRLGSALRDSVERAYSDDQVLGRLHSEYARLLRSPKIYGLPSEDYLS